MKKFGKILIEFLVVALCLVYLFPIYIVLVNSFKNRAELYENMLALPNSFSFEYFAKAMEKMSFLRAFGNSLIITVVSIAVIIVLASMTAWMFVRTDDRLSRILFMVFVATMIIPFQTIMMPMMQVMGWARDNLHIPMLNSLGGLIYMNIGFGTSMAVFLYHGFVKSIPVSLEEAATIDGCNKFKVFWKIVFPMLKPTTATVMILDVIWIWNDYLLPSLVLSSKSLRTIPLSTASFFGQFTIEWNLAMAGLMLTITPVIIFYLSAQKYIVKGVAAGAVKL
ncbi:carbohydrate ABC transporter permease [Anaerocolumna xylanovorans]|uniref:Carbohydrate ABC transporter membrane protein 2, CUT1 family (TC 3.A.1.1.-) n=1 Tax=Anaerocolumna xylanovorans DSM 12503 TaxID=1121345 RepID=A0A1M7Y9Q7_9FIRM|nr:carbohydrate ABC transporter permease [Anaerocolumna xylanovorans]SHO49321.1 carbohydrate ABC transporter membrane protein 2, CUT1 family (TC 3.A.1.1.-) [Anaerocolumna xylanovorans DSM 12503]